MNLAPISALEIRGNADAAAISGTAVMPESPVNRVGLAHETKRKGGGGSPSGGDFAARFVPRWEERSR
jgi:hypothetical protein